MCYTQLLQVVDRLTAITDQGGTLAIIYLDFAIAFDTVLHPRLLLKVQRHGDGGKTLDWIEDFLVGRKQRVRVV
jgi:hypothetical protein